MKKVKCFIQVSGGTSGLHGDTIPVMKDWIAFLPDPVRLSDVDLEAKRFCEEERILQGEIVHFQKIGTGEYV